MQDYEFFELGDAVARSGATLRDARLAFETEGTPSPPRTT